MHVKCLVNLDIYLDGKSTTAQVTTLRFNAATAEVIDVDRAVQ